MILILIGPPGAGKGTQCKRLVDKYNLKHLSSGDIFRAEIASGSETGTLAKHYIDAGQLVPDEVVIAMMSSAVLSSGDCMLDGFPRTVNQAKALDEALAKDGKAIGAIVVLDVADEVVAARITNRRVCLNCGESYHLIYSKPQVDGVCDSCGKNLVQRDDDTETVIANRLSTYHQQTEPIIAYYREIAKTVITVDAEKNIDEVTKNLISEIDCLDL